jgi:hypothetical protein
MLLGPAPVTKWLWNLPAPRCRRLLNPCQKPCCRSTCSPHRPSVQSSHQSFLAFRRAFFTRDWVFVFPARANPTPPSPPCNKIKIKIKKILCPGPVTRGGGRWGALNFGSILLFGDWICCHGCPAATSSARGMSPTPPLCRRPANLPCPQRERLLQLHVTSNGIVHLLSRSLPSHL